jgi:tetratricopeptide (TPR) repeat protein
VSVLREAFDEAIRAAEKAIEISPSFALGHLGLGLAHLFSGNASEAIEPLRRGLRLSPHDPQNFVWFAALALALYFSAERQQALEAALRALKIRPSWRPILEIVTICYVALDRLQEAQIFVEQMREIDTLRRDVFHLLRTHNPQWSEHMNQLLGQAGLR